MGQINAWGLKDSISSGNNKLPSRALFSKVLIGVDDGEATLTTSAVTGKRVLCPLTIESFFGCPLGPGEGRWE